MVGNMGMCYTVIKWFYRDYIHLFPTNPKPSIHICVYIYMQKTYIHAYSLLTTSTTGEGRQVSISRNSGGCRESNKFWGWCVRVRDWPRGP